MGLSICTTTPPMASTDRRKSCDSDDSDSYFAKTYVPLSNLPTPPLSSHSSSSSRDHIPVLDLDGDLDANLLGPALYLRNLIPSGVSLVDPDIYVVQSILASAALPLPTIALAACILDSLNTRFALSWRRSFPLATTNIPGLQELHIDSVRPEVIILAALIISVKFLDDQQSTTTFYSEGWGSRMWTCIQINATQQRIMENLRYRLLPLWTEETIDEALDEMERVGRYARRFAAKKTPQTPELDLKSAPGNGVWSAERQITPVETPMAENIRRSLDIAPETRSAFALNHLSMDKNLALPIRMAGEVFPMYTEPVLELYGVACEGPNEREKCNKVLCGLRVLKTVSAQRSQLR